MAHISECLDDCDQLVSVLRHAPQEAQEPTGTLANCSVLHRGGNPRDYVIEHPELRPLFLKREALLAQRRFARYFAAEGLAPEQQEQFITTYVEAIDARWGLFAQARLDQAAGTPETRNALLAAQRQQLDKISAETGEKLRDVFGTKLKSLGQFPLPEWGVVEKVAANVFDTPTPLASEQARQLADILIRNNPSRRGNTLEMGGAKIDLAVYRAVRDQENGLQSDGMEWFRPITDAMLEQAGKVLGPSQLATLKNLQTEQVIQSKNPRGKPRGIF